MSSSAYSACLTADPKLRSIVINSGRLLGVVGLILILTLPIAMSLRIAACLLWALLSRWELRQFHRGYCSYLAIRISVGNEVRLLNQNQEWVAAQLLGGSVVLGSLAWLRLKTADGHQFAELLRGDRRQSRDWRKLQVIWRHIGANA